MEQYGTTKLLDLLEAVEQDIEELRETDSDIAADLATELYELRNVIGRMLVL